MRRFLPWAVACVVFTAAPSVARPLSLPWQITHSINADPSFSPDGKRMVYLTVVAGREQLFIANVDGSDPRQVTHDDADHEDPTWSLDGMRIAYVEIAGAQSRIYTMDPDGGHAEPLSRRIAR